jgi:hypothetical protein
MECLDEIDSAKDMQQFISDNKSDTPLAQKIDFTVYESEI